MMIALFIVSWFVLFLYLVMVETRRLWFDLMIAFMGSTKYLQI